MSSSPSVAAVSSVAAAPRTPERREPAPREVSPSPSAAESRAQSSLRTRRDDLIDAMTRALGVEGSVQRDSAIEQAVARFAHALIHDLRKVGGNDDSALSRRDLAGMGERLDALAAATLASSAAELPSEPSPLTATTAALHVMQVPSSRLVEAFEALRRAVPSIAEVSNGAADTRGELAAFLLRLQPSPPDTGLGALLDAKV